MTAKEYEAKLRHVRCINGVVHYELLFRGRWFYVKSHDTLSSDRIKERNFMLNEEKGSGGLTYKQALRNLYNQGKPTRLWKGVG